MFISGYANTGNVFYCLNIDRYYIFDEGNKCKSVIVGTSIFPCSHLSEKGTKDSILRNEKERGKRRTNRKKGREEKKLDAHLILH